MQHDIFVFVFQYKNPICFSDKVPDAERQENNYVRNISEGVVNVYALNNKEM